MGTAGRNNLTHLSGIELICAAEAQENKHDLNSANWVTGGEVGIGRVGGGRRQRTRVEDGRVAVTHAAQGHVALSLWLLVLTATTAIDFILGLLRLFDGTLSEVV